MSGYESWTSDMFISEIGYMKDRIHALEDEIEYLRSRY